MSTFKVESLTPIHGEHVRINQRNYLRFQADDWYIRHNDDYTGIWGSDDLEEAYQEYKRSITNEHS